MPRGLNHIHTYVLYKKRTKGTKFKDRVYQCADPVCYHFTDVERIVGKLSLCNECGKQFILDREQLWYVRPRCLECSNSKKGQAARAAKKILGNLGRVLEEPDEEERIENPMDED